MVRGKMQQNKLETSWGNEPRERPSPAIRTGKHRGDDSEYGAVDVEYAAFMSVRGGEPFWKVLARRQ